MKSILAVSMILSSCLVYAEPNKHIREILVSGHSAVVCAESNSTLGASNELNSTLQDLRLTLPAARGLSVSQPSISGTRTELNTSSTSICVTLTLR